MDYFDRQGKGRGEDSVEKNTSRPNEHRRDQTNYNDLERLKKTTNDQVNKITPTK